MLKKVCLVLFAILFFLFSAPIIYAVSLTVGNIPSSIDQSQDKELDIVLSCSGCTGDSFLRAVFYPSGTSYFGYTQDNSGNWINSPGGSCTQYYKIAQSDLNSGSWSGKLKIKPDSNSSLYGGPGDYLFKVGRYTSSCGTPTWSTETTVSITGPTPTPTSAPTPTNSPSATPTKAPTSTPTKVPALSPTVSASDTPSPGESSNSGLLSSNVDSPKDTPSVSTKPEVLGISTGGSPLLFIVLGLIFIAACGILAYFQLGDKIFIWKKKLQ